MPYVPWVCRYDANTLPHSCLKISFDHDLIPYVSSPFAIPYSIHSLTSLFDATSAERLKDTRRPYFHMCRCFEIVILLAVLSKVRQTQIVISDRRVTAHFVCYTLLKYARAGDLQFSELTGLYAVGRDNNCRGTLDSIMAEERPARNMKQGGCEIDRYKFKFDVWWEGK